MFLSTSVFLALAASVVPVLAADDRTVIGLYVFSRHGDRTPKAFSPVSLTPLGLSQIVASGSYFRSRYVSDASSPYHIPNVSADDVVQSQLYATSSDDTTIYNSAQGFLMGLYPPVGSDDRSTTLRNGTTVKGVQNGLQLVPIHGASVGATNGLEEDMAWLQGATGCNNAQVSSMGYYDSKEFKDTSSATKSFYEDEVYPFLKNLFPKEKVNFKNAYTVFDVLNVASIHNSTESTPLPKDDVMLQVRTLADAQQWNLAYNASAADNNDRAISGRTLAAQIVDSLNNTLTSKGKSKIGLQFGAYATFLSFFGLAGLQNTDASFYGVPDYASTMVFELLSASATDFNLSDVSVRFLFRNGTEGSTEDSGSLKSFSLFGADADAGVEWDTFVKEMGKFGVSTQQDWCTACGNSTGVCAAEIVGTTGANSGNTKGGSKGLSKAGAGAIGAVVAIAVVLAVEALIVLLAGLRVVKKGNVRRAPSPESTVTGKASI